MLFSKHRKAEEASVDWVIVGLGNPGSQYEQTRHNMGFLVIDRLSDQWGIPVKKLKFQSQYGLGQAEGKRTLLLRPQTFMNLSGEALRDCIQFYKVPLTRTIVVYDDISLPLGKLRLRGKGSDGGHNGIKSILYQCQSDVFPRIKVGIGAPDHPDFTTANWVLGRFSEEERPLVADMVTKTADAVRTIMTHGLDRAMNTYN